MNTKIEPTRSLIIVFVLLIAGTLTVVTKAQTPSPTQTPAAPEAATPVVTPAVAPVAKSALAQPKGVIFTNYKGIAIGMTSDEVRKKLGSPEDKGDDQDFYVFSSHETAQIFYDSDHTVKAMAITYTGDLHSALTPMQVFGEDIAPNAEGGIFNMVRYPEAGFWVSYNRTAGDNPIVSIAVQKM